MLLKTETSTSAGWNNRPRVPLTAPGGQQQLATRVDRPVQASSASNEASLTPVNLNINSAALAAGVTQETTASYSSAQVPSDAMASTPQSVATTQTDVAFPNKATHANVDAPASQELTPQSSVVTYSVAAATPSNASADSFPVYYVSYPEDPNTQQQFTKSSSNTTTNFPTPSSGQINNTLQTNSDDSYPVYYVGFEEETNATSKGKVATNTSSLPASATVNTLMNNQTNRYPVYYVTGYSKGTPEAPKPTIANTSAASINEAVSQPPQFDNIPVYDVGGPKAVPTERVSKTKDIPNSPISYEIIHSTSATQDTTATGGSSHLEPPSAPATAAGSPTTQANESTVTSYSYPSNLTSYYSYSSNSPSPASYPAYEAPSPATYSPPSPSSQPIPSSYGHPGQKGSSAPSQAQPPVSQAVASSYPPTAAATAAKVPTQAPAPAPAPTQNVLSGVSSSPPFPPTSPSSTGNKQPAQSTSDVSGSASSGTTNSPHNNQLSFPQLESEYENASYVIATPPEKETVLFLPSPSFPLSPDATEDGNSTSASLQTNSSIVNNPSSQQMITTSFPSTTLPEIPARTQPTNITVPLAIVNQSVSGSNSTILPPSLNITGADVDTTEWPIIMIPENITLPNWELENTTLNNMTFMSNSSFGPPPTTPASEIPISSTTPTAPTSTAAPTTVLPPVVPPSSNKTVTSDMLNIPLGRLLNSLGVTAPLQTSKPPPSYFFTTPPPKQPAPVPGTTKPAVSFHPTTQATKKPKEWGFGDKYLGMLNGRFHMCKWAICHGTFEAEIQTT